MDSGGARLEFCVHGLGVAIELNAPYLSSAVLRALRPFEITQWPSRFPFISGKVSVFDSQAVARSVSPRPRESKLMIHWLNFTTMGHVTGCWTIAGE